MTHTLPGDTNGYKKMIECCQLWRIRFLQLERSNKDSEIAAVLGA